MIINNRKLPRFNRQLFCRNKYGRIFYVCKLHRTVFLTFRPSQVQVLGKEKKSLNRLFFLWSRRQDSPSAAAAPCILMARRPSQATVPVSSLLAKNSPPDCFLNAQTFSGSSPWQRKKEPQSALFSLVEATGLAVCCGCALHTNGSTTVASDSTRLIAPR